MLKEEEKQTGGHLAYLESLVSDLQDLHTRLLQVVQDKDYWSLYSKAQQSIQDLKARVEKPIPEIEICLNGLYGFLLLRLQNKSISRETREGVEKISAMLGYLSDKFRAHESGQEAF